MPINVWMDEGEVHTDRPIEKLRDAELWRDATIATPVPLGLAAFATAALFSGFSMALGFPVAAVLPVAFIFGGLTLWTMALFALRKGSTFAATFFGTIGSFNLIWPLYYIWPALMGPPAQSGTTAAILFFVFALIVAYLMLCAFRVSLSLALVLLTLFLSYLAAGLGFLSGETSTWLPISGWIEVVSAALAYYTSFATIWNSVTHKEQFPLGRVVREEAYERTYART